MRNLLSIQTLHPRDIQWILERSEHFLTAPSDTSLRGKGVVNIFFEASTRTRTSFEIAAKRLGAHVTNIQSEGSSVVKGESLLDTCQTLSAMRPDMIVIRHPSSGAPEWISQHVGCAVINAGDGAHEHPTQALLDALTLKRRLGRLQGLKIAICGDVLHSRVARSNILLLQKLGNEVWVTGPSALLPVYGCFSNAHLHVSPHLDEVVKDADAIMVLRLQKERMTKNLVPSFKDYARRYQVRPEHLAHAAPHAILLHPGPVNRGVEMEATLVDHPRSVILDQVQHGVVVRMAVLHYVAQTTPPAI